MTESAQWDTAIKSRKEWTRELLAQAGRQAGRQLTHIKALRQEVHINT